MLSCQYRNKNFCSFFSPKYNHRFEKANLKSSATFLSSAIISTMEFFTAVELTVCFLFPLRLLIILQQYTRNVNAQTAASNSSISNFWIFYRFSITIFLLSGIETKKFSLTLKKLITLFLFLSSLVFLAETGVKPSLQICYWFFISSFSSSTDV